MMAWVVVAALILCFGTYWLLSVGARPRFRFRRRAVAAPKPPEVALREAFTQKRAIAQEDVDDWDREWSTLTKLSYTGTLRTDSPLCRSAAGHAWEWIAGQPRCTACGAVGHTGDYQVQQIGRCDHTWKFRHAGNMMQGYCTKCGVKG
jgi:hypothetical protein